VAGAGAIWSKLQCYGNGLVVLAGSVVFGASGAIATTKGKGFTITKAAGNGTYTIVTQSSYNAVIACSVDTNFSGGAEGITGGRGAFTGNNTLTIYTVNTSGTPTNSTVTGNGFDFVLIMSTSSTDG
jgi:hypothetical protein